MSSNLKINVSKQEQGFSLRKVLKAHLPFSSKEVNNLIDDGYIFLNNKKESYGTYKVNHGDSIQCLSTPPKKEDKSNKLFLDIIYEDNNYVAFNKPPGVPAQRTKDPKRVTMEDSAIKMWKEKHNAPLILLHRLDRDTSGVLLFAKSKRSATEGFNFFKDRKIKKEYVALCSGISNFKEGVWANHLGEAGKRAGKTYYCSVRSGGEAAKTQYSLLTQSLGFSLMKLNPETGRTHQIRVHLSEVGLPIVGDSLYGTREKHIVPHHLLHARSLLLPLATPVWIKAGYPKSFHAFSKECGITLR